MRCCLSLLQCNQRFKHLTPIKSTYWTMTHLPNKAKLIECFGSFLRQTLLFSQLVSVLNPDSKLWILFPSNRYVAMSVCVFECFEFTVTLIPRDTETFDRRDRDMPSDRFQRNVFAEDFHEFMKR